MQSPDLSAAPDVDDVEVPESIQATLELVKQYRALRVLIENEMHEVRQLKQDLSYHGQKLLEETASLTDKEPSTLGLMSTLVFDTVQLEATLLKLASQGNYFAVKHDMPEQNVEAKERREFVEHVGFDYKVVRWDAAKDKQLKTNIVQFMNQRDIPSEDQINQLSADQVLLHFQEGPAARKSAEDYLWEADPYNWARSKTVAPDAQVPISSLKSLMTYRDPVNWLVVSTSSSTNRPVAFPNPYECRSRFIHFLRLSRSSHWESAETELLVKIVSESHSAAPWPVIADRLNQEFEYNRFTPCARTPTECARKYFEITYKDGDKKVPFTREEDEQLRRLVERYGDKQWQFIAGNMVGRTGPQLMHRWMKALCPKARQAKANTETTAWNTRQDMTLVCAVKAYDEKRKPVLPAAIAADVAAADAAAEEEEPEQQANDIEGPVGLDGTEVSSHTGAKRKKKKAYHGEAGRRGRFGEIRWAMVQNHVHGKLDVQCRERWANVVDPNLNVDPFTPEEDRILTEQIRICAKPIPWSKLAHEFFPGRTDAMLSRRWKKLTTGSTKGNGKKRARVPKKTAQKARGDDEFEVDLPLEDSPPPKRRKSSQSPSSDAESNLDSVSVADSVASTSVAASRTSTRKRIRSSRVSMLGDDGEALGGSGLQDLLAATNWISPDSPLSVSSTSSARKSRGRVRNPPQEVHLPLVSSVGFGFVEPSRQTLRAVSRMAILHDHVLATEPEILAIPPPSGSICQHLGDLTGKWLASVYGPSWVALQDCGGLSRPDPRIPDPSCITSGSIVDTSSSNGLVLGATPQSSRARPAASSGPFVLRFRAPASTPSPPPASALDPNTR